MKSSTYRAVPLLAALAITMVIPATAAENCGKRKLYISGAGDNGVAADLAKVPH